MSAISPIGLYQSKESVSPLQETMVMSYPVINNDSNRENKIKWNTLDHNGVVFTPQYEPHNIPLIYNGKKYKLTAQQEEIATMFAAMSLTDWVKKKTFRNNFMKEFMKILTDKTQQFQYPEITELNKCDFSEIFNWYCTKKEETKMKKKDPEYKKTLRAEKESMDNLYGWALVDGKKVKVGNYRVEPPGLFRGRGNHPKMGKFKRRIMPEDITLNIGRNATIPKCPIKGHKWGGIMHNNTVQYIAKWRENINGDTKFVYLSTPRLYSRDAKRTIQNAPNECISCVRFCPSYNLIAVASWNNTITCYRYTINTDNENEQISSSIMDSKSHDRAVLGCCWNSGGNKLFSAGCDNTVRIWNIGQMNDKNAFNVLGRHESSVKCIEYGAKYSVLITGSWDKTLKCWDERSNESLIRSLKVPSKIYCMSCKGNALLIGLSDGSIRYYDMRKCENVTYGKTKCQTQLRDVELFPNQMGYVVASMGGAFAVHYFDRKYKRYNYSRSMSHYQTNSNNFRRFETILASINVIRFHDEYGSFVTGGDDGRICVWNPRNRSRLQQFRDTVRTRYGNTSYKHPITSIDFDKTGSMMVYSTSYNWNRGIKYYNQQIYPPQIYFHFVTPSDFRVE